MGNAIRLGNDYEVRRVIGGWVVVAPDGETVGTFDREATMAQLWSAARTDRIERSAEQIHR